MIHISSPYSNLNKWCRELGKEELTIPLWAYFSAHTFCEAFHREFGGMIPGIPCKAHEATNTADLDDDTALLTGCGVGLAHDAHRVQGELRDPPEVGFSDKESEWLNSMGMIVPK